MPLYRKSIVDIEEQPLSVVQILNTPAGAGRVKHKNARMSFDILMRAIHLHFINKLEDDGLLFFT